MDKDYPDHTPHLEGKRPKLKGKGEAEGCEIFLMLKSMHLALAWGLCRSPE